MAVEAQLLLNEDVEHLDIDKMWKLVGVLGRYQIKHILLLLLPTLSASIHPLSYYFIGFIPPHHCSVPKNFTNANEYGINESSASVLQGKCALKVHRSNGTSPIEMPCLYGYDYSVPKEASIVSEWDLVCNRTDIGQLPEIMIMLGLMLGALFASVADTYGRKIVQIVSQLGVLVTSASIVFLSNFWLLCGVRLLTGIFTQLVQVSASIPLVELVPTEKRPLICALNDLCIGLSLITLTAAAYFLRAYNWRVLALCTSLTGLPFILDIFMTDESVRWLKVKNKTDDVVKLVTKICKTNNCSVEKILPAIIGDKTQPKQNAKKEDETTFLLKNHRNNVKQASTSEDISEDGELNQKPSCSSYWSDLKSAFKAPKLFLQFCICWSMWFVDNFVVFTFYLLPNTLSSDRYLNFLLAAVCALCGTPIAWLMLTRFSRRRCGMMFHFVTGLGLLVSTLVTLYAGWSTALDALRKVCSFFSRMAISISFGFIIVYTSEIFPTNLRTTGLGVSIFCGRLGGVAASFSTVMASYHKWLPGVVMCACCLSVTIAIIFLPETGNQQLPQNIEELKAANEDK